MGQREQVESERTEEEGWRAQGLESIGRCQRALEDWKSTWGPESTGWEADSTGWEEENTGGGGEHGEAESTGGAGGHRRWAGEHGGLESTGEWRRAQGGREHRRMFESLRGGLESIEGAGEHMRGGPRALGGGKKKLDRRSSCI